MGIPGCGKSTLLRGVADALAIPCFNEPEEDKWPQIIAHREQYGFFNSVHAFRMLRLPGLLDAAHIARSGGTAIVDSYYDKLCGHWIGRPGTEWLLNPEDPYFPNFLETAKLDYRFLPDADVIVLIDVDRPSWTKMVEGRQRKLDADTNLLDTFHMQGYFLDAARAYARDRNGLTRLIEFKNAHGDLAGNIRKLSARLRDEGVLP